MATLINNKDSVLVALVSYKESYADSKSYLSLLASFANSGAGHLSLIVIDNTDSDNWHVEQGEIPENVSVVYRHFSENPGISVAYNHINTYALDHSFKWVIYLDQDTMLPLNFFQTYLKAARDTTVPVKVSKIWDDKKLISPGWYICYRTFHIRHLTGSIFPVRNISCINSGIMIETSFFKSIGGYNEQLKLDFCDHDFIEKVKKFLIYIEILNVDLEQNFSFQNNTKEQAVSRYAIFLKDLRGFSRNRNVLPLFLVIDLPHLLKLIIKYRSFHFLKMRISS